ncbi:MAG: nitroreductase family protein [Bacteroidota bacterium]|nr:nitroreductase family protein [Bacteroidota bacterium]
MVFTQKNKNMFLELAKKRFSCRSYMKKEVEKEKVMQIMEAARIAPSASNKQPWFFYVVQNDKAILSKVHETYHREWFSEAPVVIIACADKNQAWKRSFDGKNHAEIDTSIAIDHITLAATDLGLSTCWICHFEANKIKDIFDMPEHLEPIALIPLAYCNNESDLERFDKQRKSIDEITKFI